MAHVIVVGNEKGGAGKSTVSMHVTTALLRLGFRVAIVDLDLRQLSIGRYVQNRKAYSDKEGLNLPMPSFRELPQIDPEQVPEGKNPGDVRVVNEINFLKQNHDFVIVDCPGSHSNLTRIAHAMANTLVTPLNDSFVDFDLLARIDTDGETIKGPSIYSEMVWSARQMRANAKLPPMDWVVLRNRMGAQAMVNKQKMENALAALSKRIGFRVIPGFNERVIFRELFPRGMTLLDLRDVGVTNLNISNIAARQEMRELLKSLKLPGVGDPDF